MADQPKEVAYKLTKSIMALNMCAMRKTHVQERSYEREEGKYSVEITRRGKPVSELKADRVTVEERVMEWTGASHIHAWFVKNVQNGKDDSSFYPVSTGKLEELLSVCERVLSASYLVPEKMFAKRIDAWPRPTQDDLRNPRKVLKSIDTAHKFLPIPRTGYSDADADYDEVYLNAVEETRTWILRMIADRGEGMHGEIHYCGGRYVRFD
ncbi:hypothetical protein [Parerythrobacter lacustris]|uniref:Uncharacterized protein n=1 Tax=Parerythrobacter lacustris TaxID=2969984 RepID=A0ABT1XPA7_9SPHN|nr:hypothetical protein [Parerythrobacter lacustris]MCR2833499.1 hypothetical protein [Parerythrobacter lacustris]